MIAATQFSITRVFRFHFCSVYLRLTFVGCSEWGKIGGKWMTTKACVYNIDNNLIPSHINMYNVYSYVILGCIVLL